MSQERTSWQQIVSDAKDFQDTASQRELLKERQEQAERQRQTEQQAAEARQTLEQLGVPDLLGVIRDGVWGEGTVQGSTLAKGFRFSLKTTVHTLTVYKLREVDIFDLKYDDTVLSLDVDLVEWSSWILFVADCGIFNPPDDPGLSLVEQIKEQKKHAPFNQALEQAIKLQCYPKVPYCVTIDHPKQTEAADHLKVALVDVVAHRKKDQSLPYQLRERFDKMLTVFPDELQSKLREEGVLHKPDLKEWEKTLFPRTESGISRAFQRILGSR